MAYLYAGLGVVMLSGIMAIFEMGLALTGQSLIPSSTDAYLSDLVVKGTDQNLLRLLNDPTQVVQGLERISLCNAIKVAYENQYPVNGIPWVVDSSPPMNNAWLNSCVMNNGAHRVLILPNLVNPSSSYQFYSCVVADGEDRCPFEQVV